MINRKVITALLFCMLCLGVFHSCKYNTEYQSVNANNKFSVSLPPWMKRTDDLKPGADLQYANRYRNFYAIGSTEGKNRPMAAVMEDNLNTLRKSLKDAVVTDSLPITVNGMQGIRVEIYGKMSGENIYFSEMVLENTANVYHLSIWTRSEERKLKFKGDVDRILNSFKAI